jgi:hypothetical protein
MWGKHYNFLYKTLWIATMFPRMFFFMFFLKIVFVNFIGENTVTFLIKHHGMWIAIVFVHVGFFVMIFFKIIFFYFIFSITITSKTKSCGKNIVVFLTKHYGLLQCFFLYFFVMISFKIILVDFIFLILR